MSAVVGEKSLVILSSIGVHIGLTLGPLFCRFMGGLFPVYHIVAFSPVVFWPRVITCIKLDNNTLLHYIKSDKLEFESAALLYYRSGLTFVCGIAVYCVMWALLHNSASQMEPGGEGDIGVFAVNSFNNSKKHG